MNDRYSPELKPVQPIDVSRSGRVSAVLAGVSIILGPIMVLALTLSIGGCSKGQAGPLEPLIGGLLPASPSQVARDLFNPYDPDVRRNALALMTTAYFGGEEVYVKRYRTLVTDQDSTVRAAAIRALGIHGTKLDAITIIVKLDDDVPFVRWEAAKALQKLHHENAISPLTKHMIPEEEENADVRIAAVLALGQYAKPRVIDALLGALNDTDFAVVHSARYSLVTLTGQDLGLDSGKWLEWSKKNQDHLFDNKKQYTWQPFDKPETFFQKMQFWKDRETEQPRVPTGLEGSQASVDSPTKPS